jgi:selenocysteine lyase/cysteine desulfurase
MDAIEAHEAELTGYALRRLAGVPGLVLYGPQDAEHTNRLGVLTFNLGKQPHARVAAILGYEHGIGVRNGCFCSHPLLYRLLHLSGAEIAAYRRQMRSNIRAGLPGAVRASLGIYNNLEEVDALVGALETVAAGDVVGSYEEEENSGEFVPAGGRVRATDAFDLDRHLPSMAGEVLTSR